MSESGSQIGLLDDTDVLALLQSIRTTHWNCPPEQPLSKRLREQLQVCGAWLDGLTSQRKAHGVVYLVLNQPKRAGGGREFEAWINSQEAVVPQLDLRRASDPAVATPIVSGSRNAAALSEAWTKVWTEYSQHTQAAEQNGLSTLNQWLLQRSRRPRPVSMVWGRNPRADGGSLCLRYDMPDAKSAVRLASSFCEQKHANDRACELGPLETLLADDGVEESRQHGLAACIAYFLSRYYAGWGGTCFTSIPILHHNSAAAPGAVEPRATSVLSLCTSEPLDAASLVRWSLIGHALFVPLVGEDDRLFEQFRIQRDASHSALLAPVSAEESERALFLAESEAETGSVEESPSRVLWVTTSPEQSLAALLKTYGFVVTEQSPRETLQTPSCVRSFDAVLVDLKCDAMVVTESLSARGLKLESDVDEDTAGIGIVQMLRRETGSPSMNVVYSSRKGDALRARALDVDCWFRLGMHSASSLARILRNQTANQRLARALSEESPADLHVARGRDAMKETLVDVRKAAEFKRPILLMGLSGTGKSAVARAYHSQFAEQAIKSEAIRRRAKAAGIGDDERQKQLDLVPFIEARLNADAYIEARSELHGHKKGSFSGALFDRVGYLEEADGGVLFLDEIHRLSRHSQHVLLDYMQDTSSSRGRLLRFGEPLPGRQVDVLVVCATSIVSYAELLSQDLLDRDFLRRLGAPITVPSLSNRVDAVEAIVNTMVERIWRVHGSESPSVAKQGLQWLKKAIRLGALANGNVAELKNILLDIAAFESRHEKSGGGTPRLVPPKNISQRMFVERLERRGFHDPATNRQTTIQHMARAMAEFAATLVARYRDIPDVDLWEVAGHLADFVAIEVWNCGEDYRKVVTDREGKSFTASFAGDNRPRTLERRSTDAKPQIAALYEGKYPAKRTAKKKGKTK